MRISDWSSDVCSSDLWLFACGPDDEQAQAPPPQPVPVGVIEAQLSPVNLGDSFVGRIEAIQKVEVRARVTGFIEARLFEEGQMVEAGASLFRIEDRKSTRLNSSH